MKEFYEYAAKHRERFLGELFGFLRQKSLSATGEGIPECAAMLKGFMEKAGIECRYLETEGHPAVYGEILVSPELPTVLVYGHYDVQPPGPRGEWDSDPFEPELRDGRIYCRGASDDKGQLFTHVKAAEIWNEVYGTFPLNMKYLFEGEEEVGSRNLENLVETHRELLACDLVVVSDSHIHESGRPSIILGLKGLLYVQLDLKGASRDLHSKFAAVVENPVWKAVELLRSLRDKRGFITIEGFYDDVREVLPSERWAEEEIPYDMQTMLQNYGIEKFEQSRYGDDYFWNMMFEPTCNIAGINAGYTGEGAKTVLPHKALVKLDFRLVPDQDPQKILQLLRTHLEQKGFGDVEVTPLSMIHACRTPVDDPYVQVVSKAIENAWGEAPLLYPSIGGSGPNHIFTRHLKAQCITVPYAGADQNNHGPNESMILSGFFRGIETNGELMRLIAEAGVKTA